MSPARRKLLALILWLAALGLAWLTLAQSGALGMLGDAERLRAAVDDWGVWGPLVIILGLAAAIVISPIPSAPIALAAGAAYGPAWGTVYVVAGAELGALIAFTIARRVGYDAVRSLPWAARLLDRAHSQTMLAGIVFVSRLMPFLSFDAVSYAAGLTRLHWGLFLLATLAGVIPVSIALVWFGDRMAVSGSGTIGWVVLALGCVTLVPLAAAAWRARRPPPG